jgi:hypothetical protein
LVDDPNREHWEQLATIHGTGADRYYDLDKLIAGGTLMGAEESAALDRATGGLNFPRFDGQVGCGDQAAAAAAFRFS